MRNKVTQVRNECPSQNVGTARIVCGAGSMKRHGVRPSVCRVSQHGLDRSLLHDQRDFGHVP